MMPGRAARQQRQMAMAERGGDGGQKTTAVRRADERRAWVHSMHGSYQRSCFRSYVQRCPVLLVGTWSGKGGKLAGAASALRAAALSHLSKCHHQLLAAAGTWRLLGCKGTLWLSALAALLMACACGVNCCQAVGGAPAASHGTVEQQWGSSWAPAGTVPAQKLKLTLTA